MSNEPAARAGDSERAAAAPEVAVSRQHRKLFAMTLAGLASVAIVAVGVGGAREAGELLEGSGGASVRAVRHRDLLQKLLGKVERGGSSLDGSAGPVELEEKNAAKAVPAKPCDASCQQRKKEIASRMKALRDQINRDFKAMTSFGHKAGYLPPPQSIKAQVMSGTLLSSSKEPVAPPPFNPSLSAKKSGASTASSAPSPPPTAVKSDDDSAAAPDSSDASDAAPANDAPALPVSDSSAASLSSTSDDTSDDSSSSSSKSSKGESTWAKAFAFMHHTDNPVVGDAASRTNTHESHHAAGKKEDPLKAAETDKFLAGFEDPDTSSSGSSGRHTKLASSSSLEDPDSPLDKGSDPLKSAETDKFLAGFLGRR